MMGYQYVGIGASCNPQPLQTRETQVKWQVFISLKTNRLNSTTSALEFYHIKQLAECRVCTFFFIQFLPRHNSKWFESNESVRNNYEVLKMKCGPRDHKDQRNWKLCSYHLWLTGVSSFDEASVVPVLLKQFKKKRKKCDKIKPGGEICVQ